VLAERPDPPLAAHHRSFPVTPFDHTISSLGALRELYPGPHPVVQRKVLDHLEEGVRELIAVCPFVLLGTADAEGRSDVSPRGGPPGFVQVLDEHRLAIPDLSGNNLLDSHTNIVANPNVGLLFVLPGRDETLRVSGRAWVTTDPEVLGGFTAELKRPKAAIGVQVEQAYIHCAKAFRRGRVWTPETWAPDAAPSAAELLRRHTRLEVTAEQIAADLEVGYEHSLADERA
jgi:PPOX class probable FMN-dependent enzyme